ncbi:Protein ABHD17C [Hondaea fermentalgiana]|uniref:Protein ABHD17C n=1 Tax=Hondaea fermentalgiana TaxID=2315210 RepID=A0A2R5GVJ7_9STRA|nr:Protein ABHD17C [Hondaea fermentalgiana]|eukprot:GBG34870.1 Protein ABHD17C [Hondaea fermentalgiana]
MGGVLSQICYMLTVEHKCNPASVAASLTFVPPHPPLYELRTSSVDPSEIQWVLDPEVVFSPFPDVHVNIMRTTRGNFIPGFLYRHPGAKLTVLFSHGNAADCGSMREGYIQLCQLAQVNVFAYDYSGYGASSGKPSVEDTYADIEAAYEYVTKNLVDDAGTQLVLMGQSVGSGPSCWLASRRKVAGLILHSPIKSGLRVLVDNRGPLCCCDIYPNIDRIKNVECPVLVVHGEDDDQVGVHHGKDLANKVPADRRHTLWIAGAGHNDIVERYPQVYYPAVGRFLQSIDSSAAAPTATDASGAPAPPAPETMVGAPSEQEMRLVVG